MHGLRKDQYTCAHSNTNYTNKIQGKRTAKEKGAQVSCGTNIHIIGVPCGKERKKETARKFKKYIWL